MAVTVFISLYTTRLLLNSLGASDFGVFNVVGGAIAMLTFLNTAMASATQRFMSISEGEGNTEKQKQIFNISIILHTIIAIVVVVIMELFSLILFDGVLNIDSHRIFAAKLIYQFLIVSTMFTIMTVPYDAVINAHENMLYYTIVGIVESVMKLVIAIFVVYTTNDKLITYGFLMATLSFVIMIVLRVYCHKRYIECSIDVKRYFNKLLMVEMTHFAGWTFLGSASSIISGYGSNIILNHFFGTRLNTATGISGQLNGQMLTFSNVLQKALNPVITKSEGSGDSVAMKKITLSGSKVSFLLFAFIAIPFLIETPYILKLWLGNIPEWALIFCRLMVIFTLLEQLTRTFGTAIAATGKVKYVNLVNSFFMFLGIPILYFVFKAGVSPVFLPASSVFFAVVYSILNIVYGNRYCNIEYGDYFKSVFLRVMIVFLLSYLAGLSPLLFMTESLFRVLLVSLFSILIFIISTYYIGLESGERKIVINLFNKIFLNRK